MLKGYIPGLRYNIKGSVATSRATPTPFYLSIMKLVSFGPSGFMYIINEFNNSLMQPRKHHFSQNTVKHLNNMHADTFGAGPFVPSRIVVLYKTN